MTWQARLVTTVGMGDAASLSGSIQSEIALYQDKGMATFLTNHDMNRVMSTLGGDVKRASHAATALLTMPGTPFIYYGEEIGMVGEKPDPQIRTPMQWTAGAEAGFTSNSAWELPNFSYKTVNVEVENSDKNSLLSLYRDLINIADAPSSPAQRKIRPGSNIGSGRCMQRSAWRAMKHCSR